MYSRLLIGRGLSRAAGILSAALAFACVLALPSPANAAPAGAQAPKLLLPRTGVVRAGERIDLRWAGDVSRVNELEIMLTTDGPERRTLQISPELDPVRGVFVWRVPDLGRTTGRFRVRYHRDGHEIEGTPSARFELLSADTAPIAPALVQESSATGFPARGATGGRSARAGEGESDAGSSPVARPRQANAAASDPTAPAMSLTIASARSRPRCGPESFPARN